MNPGQQQFYNFIIERVQEGKVEEAKSLLAESFSKQADGSFNVEYLQLFASKMISLLKPESVEEVKNIMMQFGQKM